MIEHYKVYSNNLTDPYRVVIDGVLAVDKKGNPKRFATVMKVSHGVRDILKRRGRTRNNELCT